MHKPVQPRAGLLCTSNSRYESMLIEGPDQGGQGHSGGPLGGQNVGERLGAGGRGATF
jgi:hypothetical protein